MHTDCTNYTIMAYERTLVGNAPPWHCGEQRAKQSRSPFPFLQNFVTLVLVAQDAFLFTQPAVAQPLVERALRPPWRPRGARHSTSMIAPLSHCFSQKTHFSSSFSRTSSRSCKPSRKRRA